MGSLSDFAESALLNHLLNTSYTSVATIYVALCTADPTDAATGASMNEVANANGYTRKAITFGAAATRKVMQNAIVTFDQATGAWGTITHWTLVDSATYGAGNVLAHGSLTPSVAPVSGNTPSIPSGEIQVQFSASSGAGFTDYTVHNWLDRMFRNQAFAKPATYVGLTTATIADTNTTVGTITEVSGGSYARVQVSPNGGSSPTWTTVTGGAADNLHAIQFPTPTLSWGTITSTFLVDSASGAGNVLGYDNAQVVDQSVAASDTVLFPIGSFDLLIS